MPQRNFADTSSPFLIFVNVFGDISRAFLRSPLLMPLSTNSFQSLLYETAIICLPTINCFDINTFIVYHKFDKKSIDYRNLLRMSINIYASASISPVFTTFGNVSIAKCCKNQPTLIIEQADFCPRSLKSLEHIRIYNVHLIDHYTIFLNKHCGKSNYIDQGLMIIIQI